MKIVFQSEVSEFQINNKNIYVDWLNQVAQNEYKNIDLVNYFFVSDERILEINNDFLNHDYITDIITFDESFLNVIKGDIFICIPEVRRNSIRHSSNSFKNEFSRVLVHGILHLIGYKDASDKEKLEMRSKEDFYLKKLSE